MPPAEAASLKIPCTSPQQLQAEIDALARVLEPEEREDTWEKFEKAINRFAGVTRGGGYKHQEVYIRGVGNKGIGCRIADCMLSDRGRLSGVAIELLQTMAPRLGAHFQPLVLLYLPPLVRLLARPNKIYIKRAEKCLVTIIAHCPIPSILLHLRHGLDDRADSCKRSCATSIEATMHEWDRSRWHERDLELLELCVRKMATDRDAEVRKTAKRVWGMFVEMWPERVEEFTNPLTPTIRRYLDISADGAPSKPKGRPLLRPAAGRSAASKEAPLGAPLRTRSVSKGEAGQAQALSRSTQRDTAPASGHEAQRVPSGSREEARSTSGKGLNHASSSSSLGAPDAGRPNPLSRPSRTAYARPNLVEESSRATQSRNALGDETTRTAPTRSATTSNAEASSSRPQAASSSRPHAARRHATDPIDEPRRPHLLSTLSDRPPASTYSSLRTITPASSSESLQRAHASSSVPSSDAPIPRPRVKQRVTDFERLAEEGTPPPQRRPSPARADLALASMVPLPDEYDSPILRKAALPTSRVADSPSLSMLIGRRHPGSGLAFIDDDAAASDTPLPRVRAVSQSSLSGSPATSSVAELISRFSPSPSSATPTRRPPDQSGTPSPANSTPSASASERRVSPLPRRLASVVEAEPELSPEVGERSEVRSNPGRSKKRKSEDAEVVPGPASPGKGARAPRFSQPLIAFGDSPVAVRAGAFVFGAPRGGGGGGVMDDLMGLALDPGGMEPLMPVVAGVGVVEEKEEVVEEEKEEEEEGGEEVEQPTIATADVEDLIINLNDDEAGGGEGDAAPIESGQTRGAVAVGEFVTEDDTVADESTVVGDVAVEVDAADLLSDEEDAEEEEDLLQLGEESTGEMGGAPSPQAQLPQARSPVAQSPVIPLPQAQSPQAQPTRSGAGLSAELPAGSPATSPATLSSGTSPAGKQSRPEEERPEAVSDAAISQLADVRGPLHEDQQPSAVRSTPKLAEEAVASPAQSTRPVSQVVSSPSAQVVAEHKDDPAQVDLLADDVTLEDVTPDQAASTETSAEVTPDQAASTELCADQARGAPLDDTTLEQEQSGQLPAAEASDVPPSSESNISEQSSDSLQHQSILPRRSSAQLNEDPTLPAPEAEHDEASNNVDHDADIHTPASEVTVAATAIETPHEITVTSIAHDPSATAATPAGASETATPASAPEPSPTPSEHPAPEVPLISLTPVSSPQKPRKSPLKRSCTSPARLAKPEVDAVTAAATVLTPAEYALAAMSMPERKASPGKQTVNERKGSPAKPPTMDVFRQVAGEADPAKLLSFGSSSKTATPAADAAEPVKLFSSSSSATPAADASDPVKLFSSSSSAPPAAKDSGARPAQPLFSFSRKPEATSTSSTLAADRKAARLGPPTRRPASAEKKSFRPVSKLAEKKAAPAPARVTSKSGRPPTRPASPEAEEGVQPQPQPAGSRHPSGSSRQPSRPTSPKLRASTRSAKEQSRPPSAAAKERSRPPSAAGRERPHSSTTTKDGPSTSTESTRPPSAADAAPRLKTKQSTSNLFKPTAATAARAAAAASARETRAEKDKDAKKSAAQSAPVIPAAPAPTAATSRPAARPRGAAFGSTAASRARAEAALPPSKRQRTKLHAPAESFKPGRARGNQSKAAVLGSSGLGGRVRPRVIRGKGEAFPLPGPGLNVRERGEGQEGDALEQSSARECGASKLVDASQPATAQQPPVVQDFLGTPDQKHRHQTLHPGDAPSSPAASPRAGSHANLSPVAARSGSLSPLTVGLSPASTVSRASSTSASQRTIDVAPCKPLDPVLTPAHSADISASSVNAGTPRKPGDSPAVVHSRRISGIPASVTRAMARVKAMQDGLAHEVDESEANDKHAGGDDGDKYGVTEETRDKSSPVGEIRETRDVLSVIRHDVATPTKSAASLLAAFSERRAALTPRDANREE